jgi:hypothetical protein
MSSHNTIEPFTLGSRADGTTIGSNIAGEYTLSRKNGESITILLDRRSTFVVDPKDSARTRVEGWTTPDHSDSIAKFMEADSNENANGFTTLKFQGVADKDSVPEKWDWHSVDFSVDKVDLRGLSHKW